MNWFWSKHFLSRKNLQPLIGFSPFANQSQVIAFSCLNVRCFRPPFMIQLQKFSINFCLNDRETTCLSRASAFMDIFISLRRRLSRDRFAARLFLRRRLQYFSSFNSAATRCVPVFRWAVIKTHGLNRNFFSLFMPTSLLVLLTEVTLELDLVWLSNSLLSPERVSYSNSECVGVGAGWASYVSTGLVGLEIQIHQNH